MSELEFKEIEYKYSAQKVSLKAFQELMEKLKDEFRATPVEDHIEFKTVSSWDIYYTNHKKDRFIRYRQGPHPELTMKEKTVENNNWHRVEVNVGLNPKANQSEQEAEVKKFASMLDFKENFRIHKASFIYNFGFVNYAYYIVHDEEMNEVQRFIEIEYSEKDAKKRTEKYVLGELGQFEEKLAGFGITSKNRLKKSLFEMFRRGA